MSIRPFRPRSSVAAGLLLTCVATAAADPPDGLRPSPTVNPPGTVMARGLPATRSAAGADPVTPSTPAVKAVQNLLAKAVTGATTAGKHDDMLKLLAVADQDRLGKAHADWSDVDKAAEAFQSAWRAQYGLSFSLADKVPITFTEPTMHVTGMGAGTTTMPSGQPAVTLTGPAGLQAVTLRLAHEGSGDDWRLDLPDTVTTAALHDALLHSLQTLAADQKSWPTDVDQAYLFVSERVLSSMGDVAKPH